MFRILFVALLSASATGQVQDKLDDPAFAKNVRTKFVRTQQLPDGVALATTIRVLKDFNDEDPSDATYWIQTNTGLDAGASDALKILMLETLTSLRLAEREMTAEMACDLGMPKAYGDDIFPIFDAMDDARDALAEESLITLNGKIDSDTAARLQQWLDLQKAYIVHVKFDHKEHYATTGTNADVRIARMCNEAGSTNRSTPQ